MISQLILSRGVVRTSWVLLMKKKLNSAGHANGNDDLKLKISSRSIIMIKTFYVTDFFFSSHRLQITMANKFKVRYDYDTIGFAETIAVAFRHGPKIFNKLENYVR